MDFQSAYSDVVILVVDASLIREASKKKEIPVTEVASRALLQQEQKNSI